MSYLLDSMSLSAIRGRRKIHITSWGIHGSKLLFHLIDREFLQQHEIVLNYFPIKHTSSSFRGLITIYFQNTIVLLTKIISKIFLLKQMPMNFLRLCSIVQITVISLHFIRFRSKFVAHLFCTRSYVQLGSFSFIKINPATVWAVHHSFGVSPRFC